MKRYITKKLLHRIDRYIYACFVNLAIYESSFSKYIEDFKYLKLNGSIDVDLVTYMFGVVIGRPGLPITAEVIFEYMPVFSTYNITLKDLSIRQIYNLEVYFKVCCADAFYNCQVAK